MDNYADLILAQINSPYFDEKMLEYIANYNDPELFTEKTYSINGSNLIDVFLEKGKQNLLCAIVDRFPSLAKLQDEFGCTFLFKAAHARFEKVCLKALDKPGIAQIQNVRGETFLHEAMKEHLTQVGLKALDFPDLVKLQDNCGNTFLHLAAFNELKQICLEAKKHPEYEEIKNARNKSYLDIVKENGMLEGNKKSTSLDRLLAERKQFLNEKTK